VCYALRVSGNGGWDTGYRWEKSRLLLDPRAPLVAGRKAWARRDEFEEFQQNVHSMSLHQRGFGEGGGRSNWECLWVCVMKGGGCKGVEEVQQMQGVVEQLPPSISLQSLHLS